MKVYHGLAAGEIRKLVKRTVGAAVDSQTRVEW